MAITDIVPPPGDNQDFILEIPAEARNAPVDILFESNSGMFPVFEIPDAENTSASVSA